MKYTKLGRTGLDVSRVCLGCMSYGGGNLGNHAWSLPEEESRPFIKKALEAGINFFDTANRLEDSACPSFLVPGSRGAKLTRSAARNGAGASRQKVMGFKQPDQFGGSCIFPASRYARAFAKA